MELRDKNQHELPSEDVDILVTKDNLIRIHKELEGLGYLRPYANSKHLRDTELGVKIEFLMTGEYPGDGKEKPVSFPDPAMVSFSSGGVYYLNLPALVELKLASGMTSAGRMKDLSDVLELIKLLNLPANFTDQLNPFVRGKYLELWKQGRKRYETTTAMKARVSMILAVSPEARPPVSRSVDLPQMQAGQDSDGRLRVSVDSSFHCGRSYEMLWRNKWLTSEAKTIDEMIESLRAAADQLDEMRKAGVILDDSREMADDYATLLTTDSNVAGKFGMEEEREYLDKEDDESTEAAD
jgi:hypothetical protein